MKGISTIEQGALFEFLVRADAEGILKSLEKLKSKLKSLKRRKGVNKDSIDMVINLTDNTISVIKEHPEKDLWTIFNPKNKDGKCPKSYD